MADAGVTSVVAKLGELAAAEATALLRVDAEIRALRRKLAYLQALVRGADRQRRGRASELLLLWLRETREVAFEVEDAVDEFHLRVEAFHLCRRRGNWWGWGRDAVSLVQGLVTQVKFEFRQLNPNCSSPIPYQSANQYLRLPARSCGYINQFPLTVIYCCWLVAR